jgi:sugar lactone lactonase YvrE
MKRNLFCLAVAFVLEAAAIRAAAQVFNFTTLAGSAPVGSADGVGSQAHFSSPGGVAVDPDGNVFVADSGNNTIRRITPAGVVTTFAGVAGVPSTNDGSGSNALFNQPRSVAVDTNGNILVADTDNHTIRKITPAGMVTTLAGMAGVTGSRNATGTNAQFSFPGGVAVDAAGNVYVADQANDLIRMVTTAGVVSTLAGQASRPGSADGTNNGAQFYFPDGIAVDAAGNLYVTDSVNKTIRKVAPVGTNWVVITLAGQVMVAGTANGIGTNAQFGAPSNLAVDAAANLYVADTDNNTIRKLTPVGTNWMVSTPAGQPGIWGDTNGPATNALFHSPTDVALDQAGDLYVSDANNDEIRKIDTNDVVSTLAGQSSGSADGSGAAALFWSTAGVTTDNASNIYVADYYNCTIRRVTTNGAVTTIAGLAGQIGSADGTNSDARFFYPFDLAADNHGNVFVTDTENCTVRKLSPSGTNWVVSTIAGMVGMLGHGDGPGTNASFYLPTGIAVDTNGNVYVSDYGNDTIRMIAPAGTNWMVSTLAGMVGITGHADATGTNASFYYPHGLALDAAGGLYVADMDNATIRKMTKVGTNWVVSTLAGMATMPGSTNGTGTNAQFYLPQGIAVDANGNLFVADTGNDMIRMISPSGINWVVSTVAGVARVSGSADGLGTNALFSFPQSLALDAAGDIYVADTLNNTVRLGVIASAAPPLLQITASGNQVVLAWPTTAAGFMPETVATVGAGAVWTSAGGTVVPAGFDYTLTVPIATNSAFYRLDKP